LAIQHVRRLAVRNPTKRTITVVAQRFPSDAGFGLRLPDKHAATADEVRVRDM
jgi:hypothetical protein